MVLKALGRSIGLFVILEILTALFVRAAWHPVMYKLLGIALAVSLLITILECILKDAAPLVFYCIRQKVVVCMASVVAVAIALSFCADKFQGLFH